MGNGVTLSSCLGDTEKKGEEAQEERSAPAMHYWDDVVGRAIVCY